MIRKTLFLCLFYCVSLFSGEGRVAQVNSIEIWHETFGDQKNPPLLLIMGADCQGILWPQKFCEQLAQEKFYVIRYDHRDTGLSTHFDFEKTPYNLTEMAKDGLALLDFLKVKQAHLVGFSMGGPIAELMSVQSPDKVRSITLIATSLDMQAGFLAFQGLPPNKDSLSGPKDTYLAFRKGLQTASPKNLEELLELRLTGHRLLNGSAVPFEEDVCRQMHQLFISRAKPSKAVTNHALAIQNSFPSIRAVPHQVTVPTLIFHGSEDPIFPPDHGQALAAAIKHSKYTHIKEMGHALNSRFDNLIITGIKEITQSP